MSDLIAKTAIDRRLADIVGPVIEGLASNWSASA
jgi:ribosome maturation factor RimP